MNSLFEQIVESVGTLPDSTDKEAQILAWANRAARMLYDGFDLPGSVFEQFFCVDTTQHVVTFPWYVGAIRGMRLNKSSRQVLLQDMRPRYATSPWTQPYLKYRQLSPTPLLRPLTQSGTLTFMIPVAETEPFNVVIIGQTPNADKVTEIITFNVGDTSKVSVNQWTQEAPFGITALKKDKIISSNVTVTQTADALNVAVIPNAQTEAANLRVQILDWNSTASLIPSDDCVEVLYKKRFQAFTSVDDSWIDDRLEQALVYAVKYLYQVQTGELEQAAASQAIYMKVCRDVTTNMESGQELRITMDENPLKDAAVRFPQYWNGIGYDRY